MPGIGIVGQRRAVVTTQQQQQQQQQQQLRASELSPSARNLARLLKTLQEPVVALQALQDALKQQGTLQLSNDDLPTYSHMAFPQYCMELALTVQHAHAKATGKPDEQKSSLSMPSNSMHNSKQRKTHSAYALFYQAYLQQQQQQEQHTKAAPREVQQARVEIETAWKSLSKQEKQMFEAKADSLETRTRTCKSDTSSPDTQNFFGDNSCFPPSSTIALEQASLDDPTVSPTSTEKKKSSSTTKAVSALISDSEDAGSIVETAPDDPNINVDHEIAILDFWSVLLEAMHLQVASRTVRTWGRKKIYEVYRLAGPTTPVSSLEQLRKKIADTFLALYDGNSRDNKRCMRYRDCRVFCTLQEQPGKDQGDKKNATTQMSAAPAALWIQLNIGRPMDVQDELNRSVTGEKKKKPGTEFVAMLEPESNLVALTASRAASRSTFTSYVLSALETVLTCSVAGGYASKDISAQRVHDLSGTEPFDLIQTAKAIEAGDALGRYARYAASGAVSDPITDLQAASSDSLLRRDSAQQRLSTSSQHGREFANSAEQVAQAVDSRLVRIHKKGTLVDHSSKQRKRRHDVEEDVFLNCPKRQSLRWDWKGSTSAPAASWRGDTADLPKKEVFKCRLDLKGSDVFAGMRALIQAGVLQGPLPHYMRDAPLQGGKITVNHGAIVRSDNSQRQNN